MSDLYFVRTTGAAADVKELEYVAALHQSEDGHVRANGTVSSLDVLRFLRSRFNMMSLTHKQALDIVRGFSGDSYSHHVSEEEQQSQDVVANEHPSTNEKDGAIDTNQNSDTADQHKINESIAATKLSDPSLENNDGSEINEKKEDSSVFVLKDQDRDMEEYLDLVQILSTLLIPSFARMAHESGSTNDDDGAENPFNNDNVDGMDWVDTWRVFVQKSRAPTAAPPTPNFFQDALTSMLRNLPVEQHTITEDLVEYLLLKYGEVERAQDKDLIRAMTNLAQSSSPSSGTSAVLTADVLQKVTTRDLGPWDVDCERRLSSFDDDIFGGKNPRQMENIEIETADEETPSGAKGPPSVMDRETANVDLVTDSHNSLIIVVLIWTFFFAT